MVNYKILGLIIIAALIVAFPQIYKIFYNKSNIIQKYGINFVFPVPYKDALNYPINKDISNVFLSRNLTKIYLIIVNSSNYHNLSAVGFFIITNQLTTFYNYNNYTLTLKTVIVSDYNEAFNFSPKENEVAIILVDPEHSEKSEIFFENNKVLIKFKNYKDLNKAITKFIISALKLI